MPCERKHVEAIEAAFWELVYAPESQPKLDAAVDARDAAYAACDESPCVWDEAGGGVLRPSCLGDHPHVMWSMWSRSQMTICPHCGRKIAPLLAAPEGEKP